MIDYYLVTGEYESNYEMQEFILCADTGYDVLVFAYSDGAPLTSIKRFPFRSLGSEAENVTFEIDVTPTSNGAEIAVAPSDEHAMYMWDVVDKSDLINTYNGDIAIYVDAYIDAMIENMGLYELDFARVMGSDNTTISHAFEPSTDYLVWAARVDEFGEVVVNNRELPEEKIANPENIAFHSQSAADLHRRCRLVPENFRRTLQYSDNGSHNRDHGSFRRGPYAFFCGYIDFTQRQAGALFRTAGVEMGRIAAFFLH